MKTDYSPRYIADDGKEFKDRDECIEHENKVKLVEVMETIELDWDQIGYEDIAKALLKHFTFKRKVYADAAPEEIE